MPIVSIVIPTYERPEKLRRLLAAICNQTFTDYEVIVIDDCSRDTETYRKVIADYEKQIADLTYLRNEENFGSPTRARNRGMQLAKGEFIAFCDDDDEWLPEKLEKQVEKFRQATEPLGLVYTWADTIDELTGEVIFCYRGEIEGYCIRELLRKDFIPTSSVMVRKSEISRVGGMDETMTYCCEDWDTWIRMMQAGTACGVVREVLLKYYRDQGECFSMSPEMFRGYLQFYRKHFGYAFRTSPLIALGYGKHLLSIVVKQLFRKRK